MDTSTIIDRWLLGSPQGAPRRAITLADIEALEANGTLSLQAVLSGLVARGARIRGARGNGARDVLDLLEAVRTQRGMSKSELARRAGIARQHLHELLRAPAPNPNLGTIMRLAAVLDFPLEAERIAAAPEASRASWSTSAGSTSGAGSQTAAPEVDVDAEADEVDDADDDEQDDVDEDEVDEDEDEDDDDDDDDADNDADPVHEVYTGSARPRDFGLGEAAGLGVGFIAGIAAPGLSKEHATGLGASAGLVGLTCLMAGLAGDPNGEPRTKLIASGSGLLIGSLFSVFGSLAEKGSKPKGAKDAGAKK